jgi:hypothetical protein
MQFFKQYVQSFWRNWLRIGRFLGDAIGRIILTLFYFTLFAPFGLGTRIFGDRLAIKPGHQPKWSEHNTLGTTLEHSRRLY